MCLPSIQLSIDWSTSRAPAGGKPLRARARRPTCAGVPSEMLGSPCQRGETSEETMRWALTSGFGILVDFADGVDHTGPKRKVNLDLSENLRLYVLSRRALLVGVPRGRPANT